MLYIAAINYSLDVYSLWSVRQALRIFTFDTNTILWPSKL